MNATVSLINPLCSNGTLSMKLKNVFLSLKIAFIIAKSADPGEITHYVPFHQSLYCLLKYLLWKELKAYNHMT